MKMVLELQMGNDAFILGDAGENGEEVDGDEIARILRGLADKVEGRRIGEDFDTLLRDVNGNTCGFATVS